MKNCAENPVLWFYLSCHVCARAPINEELNSDFRPFMRQRKSLKRNKKPAVCLLLSESVYKKLGEGQEAIDAKDYNLAQEIIQGALDRSRRYNENEIANLHNMLGYIYYLKDDYNGAIREYKIVVNQGEKIPEGLEVTTLYTLAQLSYVQENYDDALYYMEVWITKATNPSSAPRFSWRPFTTK